MIQLLFYDCGVEDSLGIAQGDQKRNKTEHGFGKATDPRALPTGKDALLTHLYVGVTAPSSIDGPCIYPLLGPDHEACEINRWNRGDIDAAH